MNDNLLREIEDHGRLVLTLQRQGHLRTPAAIRAFRAVRRCDFVPRQGGALSPPWGLLAAVADVPLRLGQAHLSAPYLYALALENLGLRRGGRFLNIGAGTGYFSAVVHTMLGNESTHHAVELDERAVQLARQNISALEKKRQVPIHIHFAQGDGLAIQPGEPYDSIYVGAGSKLDETFKAAVFPLLRCPGGVVVAPLDGRLKQITRLSDTQYKISELARVQYAPLRRPRGRRRPLYLPARVWSPEAHRGFPAHFRRFVLLTLAAAARAPRERSPPVGAAAGAAAGWLPAGVWLRVVAYLHPADVPRDLGPPPPGWGSGGRASGDMMEERGCSDAGGAILLSSQWLGDPRAISEEDGGRGETCHILCSVT